MPARRDRVLTVRLRPAEWDALTARAAAGDVPRAQVVRHALRDLLDPAGAPPTAGEIHGQTAIDAP